MVALIVHFSFDKEVPAEQQAVGRRKSVFGAEDVIDVSINGPGGERIKIIKMDHDYPPTVTQAGKGSSLGASYIIYLSLTSSWLNATHIVILQALHKLREYTVAHSTTFPSRSRDTQAPGSKYRL